MSDTHPSDEQLARWADGGKARRVESHAMDCPLCERRLEAITALEPRIRDQLAESLEPSDTFEQRLRERLNQRLLDQETLEVLIDLAGTGPAASGLLLGLDMDTEEGDGIGG